METERRAYCGDPFYVASVAPRLYRRPPGGSGGDASAVARMGRSPEIIEPLVPVNLVIDHSVQVDFANQADAFKLNLEMEFKRNRSRYEFLKWCIGPSRVSM